MHGGGDDGNHMRTQYGVRWLRSIQCCGRVLAVGGADFDWLWACAWVEVVNGGRHRLPEAESLEPSVRAVSRVCLELIEESIGEFFHEGPIAE